MEQYLASLPDEEDISPEELIQLQEAIPENQKIFKDGFSVNSLERWKSIAEYQREKKEQWKARYRYTLTDLENIKKELSSLKKEISSLKNESITTQL